MNESRQAGPEPDGPSDRGSRSGESESTDGESSAQPGRRVAIGGVEDCDHPEAALVSLGLGGLLAFRRCTDCEAVVVADVGG